MESAADWRKAVNPGRVAGRERSGSDPIEIGCKGGPKDVTPAEAIAAFRSLGLEVAHDPGMTDFVVAGDPKEPIHEVRRHGVPVEYAFGFSFRLLNGEWLFREKPFAPLEEFSTLESIVERGLELHRAYRAGERR
jgi:hypothetical protein